MSLTLAKFSRNVTQVIEQTGVRYRWKRSSKGKDFDATKSLTEKLAALHAPEDVDFKVNIGQKLPATDRAASMQKKLEHRSQIKNNVQVLKAIKNRTFKANFEAIQEESEAVSTPLQTFHAATYYGVFNDLFQDAYFVPVLPMTVDHQSSATDYAVRVHRGNVLKPFEADTKPTVRYQASPGKYYTLVMSSPDGNLHNEGEYAHWMVANIPGNDVSKGQEICSYLQPFPIKGIGYCRYVYILYVHDKKLDFTKSIVKSPYNLSERIFSSFDFYKERQDDMTPVGLRFFQSDWDSSLTSFFHHVLDMPEPTYEYEFAEIPIPKQKAFPHREPFNLYMDQYRDPKELQKELLLLKLKERHPFKPPPTPPKYPLAYFIKDHKMADWRKDDIMRYRVREGKYRYM